MTYLVHHLSSCYGMVSQKHLMPIISRLQTLISYDPTTEADRIRSEKEDLIRMSKSVQEEIAVMIQEKNNHFQAEVNSRILCIEQTFERLVLDIPAEKNTDLRSSRREH